MINIKNLQSTALSGDDIIKCTKNRSNVITYPDLNNMHSIEEAFNGKNSLVILYLQQPNYGHWVCLNKLPNNIIEFFDPYGFFPDSQLKYTKAYMRKQLEQELPKLSELLKKTKYKLSYNEHQFQKKKEGIYTCGRHCCVRINNSHKQLHEYKQSFDKLSKYGNPDKIVSILTSNI